MFRKSLLALMIIAALPVIAATDRTIYVNTFNDEDGENANNCSLREALKAATLNKAYGGCSAGQADITDKIQLQEGIYKISSPLVVGSPVNIYGAEAADFAQVNEDPITNLYPVRTPLKTTIEHIGSTRFSLIDSSVSRASLGLNNIILKNGDSDNGGAILSGGSTTLSRVNIINSKASTSGGAIYLAGSTANLTASDTLFQTNTAPTGAVIGMSCIDNVRWTPHVISLERTSIIENGNANSKSIIAFCGTPTATISTSTIAKNQIQSAPKNAILQYIQDEADDFTLHPNSTLQLLSNTIVNNSGYSTLLYDNVGGLNLLGNVLAYNSLNGGVINGKSCRYSLGKEAAAALTSSKVAASFNAIFKPSDIQNVDECELPASVTNTQTDTLVDLTGKSFSTVFSPLSIPTESPSTQPYLLPYYLPKAVLVDVGGTTCPATDQRQLNRNIVSDNQSTRINICDIGAIELGKLVAANISNATNTSLVELEKQYDNDIKFFGDLAINKDTDAKLVERYKFLRDLNKTELAAFLNQDNDKAGKRYRQAFVNIFSNSIEQEDVSADGSSSTFLKFAQDKYNVTTQALGTGPQQFIDTRNESLLNKNEASNQECRWNPILNQVMFRRTNSVNGRGAITPAGDFEYCKYTLSLKDKPEISSSGYIQATFVNIAPIATDDNYTVKYGSNQEVSLNILANDNDNGDGEPGIIGYPDKGKAFFEDAESKRFSNIKITKAPTQGKLIFEYEQPCPDNSATRPEQTCFGGKLTYKANSTFSPFNDSFKYKVLDNELLESNEATVNLVNTATTTDDTRGKGGSLGIVALLGLAGLAALRRKIS